MLRKCRECESMVSPKAAACPRCGHPLKKPRRFGCLSVALSLGLIWFAVAAIRSRPSAPVEVVATLPVAPAAPAPPVIPAPAVSVPGPEAGETAVIDAPGRNGVWLATTEADRGDMAEAVRLLDQAGPRGGAKITRMAEAGHVRIYANGSKVKVISVDVGWRFVEIAEGEATEVGRSGWVQGEFVRRP